MPEPTGQVVLRDVTEDDLPVFFEDQLDPEATRMAAFAPRDREAFMAHWRTGILGEDSAVARTVVFDGRVAGNIVSWEQSGRRLVGYWVGRPYWGKGIATRALSAFLGVVRERPLHAHVAVANVASIRVLHKCGFKVSDEIDEPGPPADGVEEVLMVLEGAAP
jgi:RimJ/RimL family protein N-acetyltransferase